MVSRNQKEESRVTVDIQLIGHEYPEEIIRLYDCYCQNIINVKNTKKADLFFSSYDAALSSIRELCNYKNTYTFSKPISKDVCITLENRYNDLTKTFLMRKWNYMLQSANKLKTEKGKQNRIANFFAELQPFHKRLLIDHINLLKKMEIEHKEIVLPKISFQCGHYLLSSIDDIQNIPNTEQNIAYDLQRAATDFKRNNQLDLAIACLRKSNELSDCNDTPIISEKDYFRLVKYLEYDGQKEMAAIESDNIYRLHPEFLDKRISNLRRIKNALIENKIFNTDLIMVDCPGSCPICGSYKGKIYSISGKSKIYPILPKEISQDGGFCPNCILSINAYFKGINKPPTKIQANASMKQKICPNCRQYVINTAVMCPNCHYDFLTATFPNAL